MTRGGKRNPPGGRKPRPDGPMLVVSTRLPQAEHAELSAIADTLGVTVSALVASLIRDELAQRRGEG